MSTVVDLATRQSGSIEVALIYDRADQSLVVFVHDTLTGEELSLPVSGDEATEVYRHPYAYAHRAQSPPAPVERAPRRIRLNTSA
jgi:hypothetical protein